MAEAMYAKNKNKLIEFAPNLTHYHRLVERFGLIEDIKFCLTNDVANVLPVYIDGKLVAK
jgi:2-phosphosulfolactate phosphatase